MTVLYGGAPRVPTASSSADWNHPRAAPALAEDPRDVLAHLLLEQQRPASLAVERGDRHAPDALARDDPLRPVGHHAVHALLAPRRDPLDVALDRLEDAGAEPALVELDEPV